MKYLYISVFLLLGCTAEFEDINTNPTAPTDVEPQLLLRQVLFDYTEQMSYEGFVAGSLLSQHFTSVDFNLFDRHSLTESQFGGNPWDILYRNLRDIDIVLEKSRATAVDAVYEGPALILKAYMAGVLTDLYGDVPYTEALGGKQGNVRPRYDTQEEIYTGEQGIISSLEEAMILVDQYQGTQPLQGDILYDGDLQQWKKLAGSLLIKHYMRMSDVKNVQAPLLALYESTDYITNASADAVFVFSPTEPNNFRMSTARIGDYNLYLMSETIEAVLESYNDPRIETYFRGTAADELIYRGLLNGQDASNLSISVADYSLTGAIFREGAGRLKGNIMTSWETSFFLAEAAEKGLITADAKQLYEQGIAAAFEHWEVDMPADYLQRPGVQYGISAEPLEQIATQKWLANIINGYEGWIDYRRTGYPQLRAVAASLNQDRIPVRMPYPPSEQSLNLNNYIEAANATDNNSVNARTWWDVD